MAPILAALMSRTALKYGGSLLVIAIALGGTYYKGYKDRGAKETAQQLEAQKEWNRVLTAEIQKNNKLSFDLESARKNVRVVRKEVIKYVTKEIEKPIYTECIVPPSGVSALNAAADKFNREREENNTRESSD